MAETFNLNFLPPSVATWLINTTPFFPIITEGEETEGNTPINVTFNKGYIFDYANKGTRIEVAVNAEQGGDANTLVLNTTGETKIQIRIIIDNGTGKISQTDDLKPKIIKENDQLPAGVTDQFENLKIINELDTYNTDLKNEDEFPDAGDDPKGDHQYILLDLCTIENGVLKELYVRENIHIWFRGVRNLKPLAATKTTYGVNGSHANSLLKVGDEEDPNGLLDVKSLFFPPTYAGNNNAIQVFDDGESIGLFVQGSTA